MNLFWRSWNKLHVIFYILALRQVLINLCEKTQYLHNREFFFQKGKLFKNYLFLNFSWNCCIVFCLLKDWNTLLCTSLIQPLKKRFFPKTCVTKTKYSTYMKKIPYHNEAEAFLNSHFILQSTHHMILRDIIIFYANIILSHRRLHLCLVRQ